MREGGIVLYHYAIILPLVCPVISLIMANIISYSATRKSDEVMAKFQLSRKPMREVMRDY